MTLQGTQSSVQEFVWEKKTAKPMEGKDIEVTLTAKPLPVQLSHATALSVDTTGYTVSPTSHSFDAADDDPPGGDGPMAAFTIKTPNTDGNRDPDTIMVNALVAGTATSRGPALKIDNSAVGVSASADKRTDSQGRLRHADKERFSPRCRRQTDGFTR